MNILCFSEAFARAKRAQRSPIAIENGNQSIAENLVMTSAYVVRRPNRLQGGGEPFSRAEKRVPDIHVAFRFSAKLTILGATSRSLVFGLGQKGWKKLFWKKFSKALLFAWSRFAPAKQDPID